MTFLIDSIALTGHRDYPDRAAIYRGLDQLHAKEYYFGGARGFDSDALEYVSRTQPNSLRTVVLPNRLQDQPIATRAITSRNATRIIELGNSGPDRYQIRNQYMVDNTKGTVAFYDLRKSGGTLNTINYSESQNKLVKTNLLAELDHDKIMSMTKDERRSWILRMRNYKIGLSSIKMILLEFIETMFAGSVQEFCAWLGLPIVNYLEKVF